MTNEEITQAQAVIREFGYDVHDHCEKASGILVRLGMYEEAERTIGASRVLLGLLKDISGNDFLLTS